MRGEKIVIAHDYVRLFGTNTVTTDLSLKVTGKHTFASNNIVIPTYVTVDIKGAQRILLPHLQAHKYMQPAHLEDRVYTEDDQHFQQHQLTEPRYKKGDKYPSYSYGNSIIHYYEDGKAMVAVALSGEKDYTYVTEAFYNKFVLPNL